jgi:hypothetical protein
MRARWIGLAFIAGTATLIVGSVSAQQTSTTQPSIMKEEQPSIMKEEDDGQTPASSKPARKRVHAAAPALEPDPNLDADDQLAPSQVNQPMPAAVPEPSRATGRKSKHATDTTGEPGAAAKVSRGTPTNVVTCSGPFSRDSSHLKLAMLYDSRNVTFSEVDGGSGNKVMASVLFAKDPKRRLEIWWSRPENRRDIYLIVINGQSNWGAPGKMHLGQGLTELEKLNGKPFKLKGFDKDGVARVSDWDGGALASLAGGCRAGVSLKPDLKASPEALGAFPADHEFSSSDPALRAVKPAVSEILLGY